MSWLSSIFGTPSGEFLTDNSDIVFLDDTGASFLPLECDPDEYEKAMNLIRNRLRNWMMAEISLSVKTYANLSKLELTAPYQLNDINVKFLPTNDGRARLESVLNNPELQFSISRFFDAVLHITMNISPTVRDVIIGRFLHGVCYTLPITLNGDTLPTKRMWVDLILDYPWVPYLLILQDLYANDDMIEKSIVRGMGIGNPIFTPPVTSINTEATAPSASTEE